MVPVFTVSVAGPNAILAIVTELPEVGGVPPDVVLFDLLQHQFTSIIKIAAADNTPMPVRFIKCVLKFK